MEKMEPQAAVGGKADWCGHCGKQCLFLRKLKLELLLTWQFHCWDYPKNPETPIQNNLAPQCS